MSNKPDTYIDGAGRVKCSTCGGEQKGGICDCNRRRRTGTIFFKVGETLWNVGEEYDIQKKDSKATYKVKITDIKSIRWDTKGRLGVLVKHEYTILDVLEPGVERPKLKLVK